MGGIEISFKDLRNKFWKIVIVFLRNIDGVRFIVLIVRIVVIFCGIDGYILYLYYGYGG